MLRWCQRGAGTDPDPLGHRPRRIDGAAGRAGLSAPPFETANQPTPADEPTRSITTCGMRARGDSRRQAADDLGAVLGLDHLVGLEPGPGSPSACRRSPGRARSRARRRRRAPRSAIASARSPPPSSRRRRSARALRIVPAIEARLTIQPRDSPQQRDRLARHEQQSAQVDPELQVDVLRRRATRRVPPIPMPARVDEHVEAAEALAVLGDDAHAVVLAGDVGGHAERAELAGGGVHLLGPCARRASASKPSSRSIRAIARPMPDEPPVTSALAHRARP